MMILAASSSPLVQSLSQRHQQLVARWVDSPPQAAEIESLMADIAAAGTTVPPGPERDALRNLLYFWAGDQASREQRPRDAPAPQLAPYDGKSAAPEPAEALPAEGADQPSTGAASDANAEARAVVRFAALARQWRRAGEDNNKGYLLTGKALVEASLFAERDPDIQAFVEASAIEEKANDKRKRWGRGLLYGLGVVAVIASLSAAYLKVLDAQRAQRNADLSREYAESIAEENRRLSEAQTRSLAERDELRVLTQAAIDGLYREDLQPLQKLLEKAGGADPEALRGLQVRPATAAGRETDVTLAPVQRANPPVQQTAAPGNTCTGYLWFGSKGDSRIEGGRDPNTLKPGDTVTLDKRADIRLRSAWPTSTNYAMARQVGLVPGGAQVKVTSEPEVYTRSLGDQVWTQVTVPATFCSTVFVQFQGGDARKLDAVLNALRALGVQTPPAERINTAKGLAQVRYFWPADKPVADEIAAALASFNGNQKLDVVDLGKAGAKPSQGTVEVWLDLKS